MLEIFAKSAEEIVKDKIPQGTLDMQAILNWAYAILGVVAVIGITFGAVVWTTSQGDPAKVKKGRDAVIFAVIGLVIVILATVITNFVITSGATPGEVSQ